MSPPTTTHSRHRRWRRTDDDGGVDEERSVKRPIVNQDASASISAMVQNPKKHRRSQQHCPRASFFATLPLIIVLIMVAVAALVLMTLLLPTSAATTTRHPEPSSFALRPMHVHQPQEQQNSTVDTENQDDDIPAFPMQEPLELEFETVSPHVDKALGQIMNTTALVRIQWDYDSKPAERRVNQSALLDTGVCTDDRNTKSYQQKMIDSHNWISLVSSSLDKNQTDQSHDTQNDSSNNYCEGNCPPCLLCILEGATGEKESNYSTSFLAAIRQTWASHCDGVVIATIETNETATQSLSVTWPVVWHYIYNSHYSQYHWFHYGTAQSYVLVENLRAYVDSDEIQNAASSGGAARIYNRQVPLWLGGKSSKQQQQQSTMMTNDFVPMGYTLNQAALKLLVTRGIPMVLETMAESKRNNRKRPPAVLARVLQRLRVSPYDTSTPDTQQERYHPLSPAVYWNKFRDCHYSNSDTVVNGNSGNNENCPQVVAPHSIAFHSINQAREFYELYALLHSWCDK